MNATSVIWNVGDTVGRKPGGGTSALPGDFSNANSGTGAPSGAPSGSPFYVNTSNNKLYAWTGAAWVAISGANT
jgi:hypothetical protein